MLLVGFFLTMASGVCYHVLPRWTGVAWASTAAIRWHYRLVAWGLPLMVLALSTDRMDLFLIAGPVQAAALLLFLGIIAPLVIRLPGGSRATIMLAALFLVFGLTLAIIFAVDAGTGARLRQAHAIANLFGWGGLLISGFGLRFLPGFAGAPLRWPRLASAQVGTLAAGVALGIVAATWRAYADAPEWVLPLAQAIVAVGLLAFAAQVAGTFFSAPARPVGQVSVPFPARL